jgi:hypothetical protein
MRWSRRVRHGHWAAVAVCSVGLAVSGAAAAAVSPSQVLVLYNADWTDNAPFTDPGQDSKEIAEHYVRMHTDPQTAERPYLLGLRCRHGAGHLNGDRLVEGSRDNGSGVVLRRGGKLIGSAGNVRDSRALELCLPKEGGAWRRDSLRVQLKGSRGDKVVIVEGGKSRFPDRVRVAETGAWAVRTDGREFMTGPLVAEAFCEDEAGKLRRWTAEYEDFIDVSCSRTGPDGVRDDQNYLEDVERPVKAFLEDPANARPDGTLLKDHVLFFVVCYGLPKTAPATYGIARGVTDSFGDHGAQIDLGQRLQLLFYDLEGALGFTPRAHRFGTGEAFTAYLFRAPQAWPLMGISANPYLHPGAYRKKGGVAVNEDAVPFTTQARRGSPGRHLYFSMRLDGATCLEARALIDRAAYATRYGGSKLGSPGVANTDRPSAAGPKAGFARDLLTGLGFRLPARGEGPGGLLAFLWLPVGAPFLHRTPVYLPGGVGATVISNNAWNFPLADIHRRLIEGVTITACAARAEAGVAPHIHDHSWWDDEVLYPSLLAGKTMGECLLMNQQHLEWIASFVGDPLYRLPEDSTREVRPPSILWDRDVMTTVERGAKGQEAVWMRVDLRGSADQPQVAQMRAVTGAHEAVCSTFEGRPYALLGKPADVYGREWTLEFVDPWGNRQSESGRLRPSH